MSLHDHDHAQLQSSLPHQIRVLVISDHKADYALIQEFLSGDTSLAYAFDSVSDYEQAMALLRADLHDVCLLGEQIGGRSSYELAREAREQSIGGPMIILAERHEFEGDLKAMQAGAVGYLARSELNPTLLERSLRYAFAYSHDFKRLEKLKGSEAMYRAMFEQAPIGIAQVSPDGTIQQVNRAFCEIGDYDANALLGESCFRYLDTRSELPFQSLTRLLSDVSNFGPLEASYFRRDRELVPLQLKGTQFQDRDGDASLWLFIEDVSRQVQLQEEVLLTGQRKAVGAVVSQVRDELSTYLETIRNKTEQVLHHERGDLSRTGQRELEVVVEQCESLLRLLGPFLVREQEKVVASQGLSRVFAELRLRILRERGGRALRAFLMSQEGRTQLEQVLRRASRMESEAEGLASVRTWLLQQDPPLLPPYNEPTLWSRLQPVVLLALQNLRLGIEAESQQELPTSEQGIAPVPVAAASAVTVPWPAGWQDVQERLVRVFGQLQLDRWCQPERFAQMVKQWLDRAAASQEQELSLGPLWEELHKISDLNHFLLAHFLRVVARRELPVPLRLPPLLNASEYGEELSAGDDPLERGDGQHWSLLPLPWRWREAIVAMVDGFLRTSLHRWLDPIAFEQFLERRLAWFLLDDALDLTPLQAHLADAKVPPHIAEPFWDTLRDESFSWNVIG